MRFGWILGAALALAVVGARPVDAVVMTTGCANAGVSCTLAELFGGGEISVDGQLFDGWTLDSEAFTAATGPDYAGIEVLGLDDDPAAPGLEFFGNGELVVFDLDFLLIDFVFNVTAPAPSITGVSLEISDRTFGGSGGRISIDEAVFDTGFLIADLLVESDNLFETETLFDDGTFGPVTTLLVEKDLVLEGDGAGDTVELVSFVQRFEQAPEPGAVLLVGLVFAAAYARRRRTI